MKFLTFISILFLFHCSDASKGILPLFGLGGGQTPDGGITTSVSENASLKSIQISPSSIELAKELEANFTATAIYSDGTKKDVTSEVDWTVQDDSILESNLNDGKPENDGIKKTNTKTGKKKMIRGISPGETKVRAAFGGITGEARVIITDESVEKIEFPKLPSLPVNQDMKIQVGAVLDTNKIHPVLPHHISISGNSTASAEIDPDGTIHPQTAGELILIAGIAGVSSVNSIKIVEDRLLSILVEGNSSLVSGLKSSYKAFAIYESGKKFDVTDQVTWTAEDSTGKLDSESQPGLLEALSPGELTLRASYKDQKFSKQIQITAPKLISLSLNQDAGAPSGLHYSFRALAGFDDGTTRDVTSQVTWESENPSIVSISNSSESSGSALALNPGEARITATIGGISTSASFKSTPAELKSVHVSGPGTLPLGFKNQFRATALYSDGTTRDITSEAHWSINGSGEIDTLFQTAGTFLPTTIGSTKIQVSFGGKQSTSTIQVNPAKLTSISVSPDILSIPKGIHKSFSAWGTFTDGTKREITRECTWIVDSNNDGIGDNSVGEISNTSENAGMFAALKEGNAFVSASLSGVSGTTKVSVNAPELLSISLVKPEFLVSGLGGKIQALGLYSDGTSRDLTADLSYSITGSLFITPETGIITTGSSGEASITASLGNQSISFNLSIKPAVLESLSISPPPESIPKGVTVEVRAFGKYSDGTISDLSSLVTWISDSNGSIQKSNEKFYFSGTGLGQSGLKVAYGGKEVVSNFPITDPILTSLTLESPSSIASGLQVNIRAIGTYSDFSTRDVTQDVVWSSSGIGSIENSLALSGIFKSTNIGSTIITAKLGSIQKSKTLEILPPEISSLQFNLEESSFPSGTQKNLKIFAALTDGSIRDITGDVQFSADSNGDNLNDENVISISNHPETKGLVKAVSPGNVSLKVSINGKSITKNLTITEAELVSLSLGEPKSIAAGLPLTLKAMGTFTDNSTQDLTNSVVWSISGKGSLDHSHPGQFLSSNTGMSTITASYKGVSQSISISTLAPELKSLTLSSGNYSFPKGSAGQIRVTGILTDNSSIDLTESASFFCDSNGDGIHDDLIASVSNLPESKGRITTKGIGSTSVLISVGGKHISTALEVRPAELSSISINPPVDSIPLGTQVKFTATGFYTDNTHQDLTNSVQWSVGQGDESMNPVPDALLGNLSSVSIGGITSMGYLSTSGLGEIRITASLNSIRSSRLLTIKKAEITEIILQTENTSVPKGIHSGITAIGKYTDNTTQDISSQATWISDSNGDGIDDQNVLSISNDSLLKGQFTALNPGTATVRAIFQNKEGIKTISVGPATPTSLLLSSVNGSRPKGISESFEALATYTDGSVVNVTSSITWIADSNGDGKNDTAVASISNSPESKGRLSTTNTGSVKIIALLGGLSSSLDFLVLPSVLQSITIQPESLSLAKGFQRQFTARGRYSDGAEQDITTAVTWISDSDNNNLDDSLVASISNSAPKNGLVTGITAGTSRVLATHNGITSNSLSVNILDSNTIGTGSDPKLQVQEISSSSIPFTFQANRNLGIQALLTDPNGAVVSGALVEFLTADESALLFGQISPPDGRVNGSILVNNSETALIARITTGSGVEKITVPIQRDSGNGDIRLVINILGMQIPNPGSSVSQLPDGDRDGIPDSRDAFPGDPKKATRLRMPATGNYTITFEDKYPEKGDSDLNDYVAYAVFEEDLNAAGDVVELRGRFQHVARGAIDNLHYLNWRLPPSASISRVSTSIFNGDGKNTNKGYVLNSPTTKTFSIFNALDSSETLPWQWSGILYRPVYNVYDCPLGINCFESGFISLVTIQFTQPIKRELLGNAPYDVFLSIKNSNREIHFPGLVFVNGKDSYLDSSGFPWAILIPGSFQWPKLTIPSTSIYSAYPDFDKWAKSRGTKFQTWYNNPNRSKIYTDGSPSSILTAK